MSAVTKKDGKYYDSEGDEYTNLKTACSAQLIIDMWEIYGCAKVFSEENLSKAEAAAKQYRINLQLDSPWGAAVMYSDNPPME